MNMTQISDIDRYNHGKVMAIVAQLQSLEKEEKAKQYVLPNSEPAMFRNVAHAIEQKDTATILENSFKITRNYVDWWQ